MSEYLSVIVSPQCTLGSGIERLEESRGQSPLPPGSLNVTQNSVQPLACKASAL